MVQIFVQKGQSIESALAKFKAKLKKAGVIEDHKRSLRFEKRSDVLRRERYLHKRRARKSQRWLDSQIDR